MLSVTEFAMSKASKGGANFAPVLSARARRDHCMGAALYAQKAIKLAGMSYMEERNWQEEPQVDRLS